jgi:predicted ester cyclase
MKEPITEEQAEAIGDCYVRARNEGNLALLDEIYSRDVTVHDPSQPAEIVGLAALKAQYGNTHAAVPDVKFSLDDLYFKGDKIAWIFTMSGTISGPFRTPLGELPPTGKSFRFSGVAVDRIVGGKIAEEWVYFNVLDILQPLGFTLAPPDLLQAETQYT